MATCQNLFTCGLQVVAFVWMFVEEEVVSCRVFGDSHRQVLQLCRLSAAQTDQLLFGVYLLSTEKMKHYSHGWCWTSPCFKLHAGSELLLVRTKSKTECWVKRTTQQQQSHVSCIAPARDGRSPALATAWPSLNSLCVLQQTIHARMEQNKLLSWKAFRVTSTKGSETQQQHSHNYSFVLCTDLIMWHKPIEFQWEEQSLFWGKITTSLCLSVHNCRLKPSECYQTINIQTRRADSLFSTDWSITGQQLAND